jgi:hypothetical protein
VFRWSHHDEQPLAARLLAVTVLSGVVLRVLPRRLDVFHTVAHGIGVMAPTCGMTRAGLALLRLDAAAAWQFNPGIFMVAVIAVLVATREVLGRIRGRWFHIEGVSLCWLWAPTALSVIILWVHQQARFDLLVQ